MSLNRATAACPSGASVWIRKRSGEASKHLPHELREARPRQPVGEGLARDSGVVLMIELAQQVRDRFGLLHSRGWRSS
jgi:hypothetical protein